MKLYSNEFGRSIMLYISWCFLFQAFGSELRSTRIDERLVEKYSAHGIRKKSKDERLNVLLKKSIFQVEFSSPFVMIKWEERKVRRMEGRIFSPYSISPSLPALFWSCL